MFYWWNNARVLEVAVCWHDRRDIWVFELVWVRILSRSSHSLHGFSTEISSP